MKCPNPRSAAVILLVGSLFAVVACGNDNQAPDAELQEGEQALDAADLDVVRTLSYGQTDGPVSWTPPTRGGSIRYLAYRFTGTAGDRVRVHVGSIATPYLWVVDGAGSTIARARGSTLQALLPASGTHFVVLRNSVLVPASFITTLDLEGAAPTTGDAGVAVDGGARDGAPSSAFQPSPGMLNVPIPLAFACTSTYTPPPAGSLIGTRPLVVLPPAFSVGATAMLTEVTAAGSRYDVSLKFTEDTPETSTREVQLAFLQISGRPMPSAVVGDTLSRSVDDLSTSAPGLGTVSVTQTAPAHFTFSAVGTVKYKAQPPGAPSLQYFPQTVRCAASN